MKKIFTVCMLALSIMAANAAELVCEGFVHRSGNNNCSYSNLFKWTSKSANTAQLFAMEEGALSDYATLKITLSNFTDLTPEQTVGTANKVRVLFLAGSTTVKTKHFATINGQEKVLSLINDIGMTAEDIATITEIAIGGSCDAGSVEVNPQSIKLVKADESEWVCEGFVKRNGNPNCSFGNTFSWKAASANTMQLFALTAGDLAAYDSMFITMSNFSTLDSTITPGAYKVRVLFLAEGSIVKTQNFSTIDGKQKKLVLADLMTAEQIATIDEIAIGGACASGSINVNAEDIKLVNDQTTAIDNVYSNKSKAVKVIRDGRLLIIRDGKTYNVLGF